MEPSVSTAQTSDARPTPVLLGENAAVLSIVPSLAPGLLRSVEYIETVYSFLETHRLRALRRHDTVTAARLGKIRAELELLHQQGILKIPEPLVEVDANKTVLLAHAVGPIYTEALALATGHAIRIEVYDDTQELDSDVLRAVATSYLSHNRGATPVFVRVARQPLVEPSVAPPQDSNVYLHLRRILEKMGATVNLDTFAVEQSNVPNFQQEKFLPSSPEVTVNVYNWYCSCEEFAAKIAGHHQCTSHEMRNQITIDSSPIVAAWFRDGRCNHVSPLPLCMHLLAVVIALHNVEQVPPLVHQVRTWSDI